MKEKLGNLSVKAEIQEPNNRDTIESFHDVTQRYDSLKHEQKEHLYAVFLNNANRFIADKIIGIGSRDTVQADLQDVVRTAALTNAGAVILIHNHPSGKAGATPKDKQITQEAHDILEKINVQLLDHVIITHNTNHSMKQHQQGPF